LLFKSIAVSIQNSSSAQKHSKCFLSEGLNLYRSIIGLCTIFHNERICFIWVASIFFLFFTTDFTASFVIFWISETVYTWSLVANSNSKERAISGYDFKTDFTQPINFSWGIDSNSCSFLSTLTLTKKNLLEIFNKHYNLLELKLLAEDKIRLTRGNISLSIENKDINFEILQDELKKLVDENNINNNLENALILNSSNTSNILNNINSSNLNDLPSFNLNTIYDTSNLNLQELKNFFSNQLNKNIEPFSNYDNKKRNQLSLEGTLNNIFNNTKVGNIFTNY